MEEDDSVQYFGQVDQDGNPHGFGIKEYGANISSYKNKRTYAGYFFKGERFGIGMVLWPSERIIVGSYDKDQLNG